MADGFPKTGDTVYWADGKQTALNLDGVDPLTSPFPNTDEAFFRIFGENWATKPDEFASIRGVRQSLTVDAETIGNGVSRVMEEMSRQPNGGEWGLPPFAQHTDLLRHVIAATKFENGWAGSAERRKYLPGSVASDPRPKPPAVDPEITRLRQQLAESFVERDRLKTQATKLEGQVQDLQKQLAEKPAAGDGKLRKALSKEVNRARGVLGKRPAGKWWQKYEETVNIVEKLVE